VKKKNADPLAKMRNQLEKRIFEEFTTVEQFCWDKDLNKATISNFLNDKKDFRVSTLRQIAEAIGRKLVIRME